LSGATRRRLLLFGAVWGFCLATLASIVAFDDPGFAISPFLVAYHLCAAASGALGTLSSGRRYAGRGDCSLRRPLAASVRSGAYSALVTAALGATSIWLALAVNLSGFSTATPAELANLVANPGLFVQSGVGAVAVFLYLLSAGLLAAPLTGTIILKLAGVRFREDP
jgi:hypothetical protein